MSQITSEYASYPRIQGLYIVDHGSQILFKQDVMLPAGFNEEKTLEKNRTILAYAEEDGEDVVKLRRSEILLVAKLE
jgi:hypothetical protein